MKCKHCAIEIVKDSIGYNIWDSVPATYYLHKVLLASNNSYIYIRYCCNTPNSGVVFHIPDITNTYAEPEDTDIEEIEIITD